MQDGDRITTVAVEPISSENFLWNGYVPESTQVENLCVKICKLSRNMAGVSEAFISVVTC